MKVQARGLTFETIKRIFFRREGRIYKLSSLALFSSLITACASAPSTLSPHGPDAARVANLFWLMLAISGVVLIVIVALLLLAPFRSRRNPSGPEAYANDGRTLLLVLIGGALIPIIVLLVIMGLGIATEQAAYASTGQGVTVEVIGHQWWWEVRYQGQDFETANEIHIPAGQMVTLKVSSADVIHSFWVPELHGKIDVIPGQTNTITIKADRNGVYRGQCAEFCGVQHAHMALFIVAEAPDQFQNWLQEQNAPAPEPAVGSLEQEGQQAFLGSSCVYCHTIKGTNASGKVGPDLTHLGSRLTIGAGTLPNTPGNLAGWMVNSQTIKPGNRMPPMDLNSDQIQALLAYLKTLK